MSSFSLIDLHQDLLLHIKHREFYPQEHWQTNFEKLSRANGRLVTATAFPVPPKENYFDSVTNELIESDLKEYNTYCIQDPRFFIVRGCEDVTKAVQNAESKDVCGILLHVEGLNVFENNDWTRLEHWYDIGWRSLGIVWNLTNGLGGGTKDPIQGLTRLGAEVIEWCQHKRMIIDFAHMNERTFFDVMKIVQGPIIVSHGNAYTLCSNQRNYTDEQLRCVAERDGVVGIFFAKTFLTGEQIATVTDVANHMDHFRKVMGIDHIAIGSDFGGIITGMVKGLDAIDRMPLLWQELEQRGYSFEMIEKIAWKNTTRVLHDIL